MVVSLGGSSVSMVLVDMVVVPEMLGGYTALFVDGYYWLGITLKSRFTCTFAFIALSSELFKNQDHTDTTDFVFALVLPSLYKVVSDWLDPLNSSPAGQLHGCIFWLVVVCLGCVSNDGDDWPALI